MPRTILAFLLAALPAAADPATDGADVLLGTDDFVDGDVRTMRLSIRGETTFAADDFATVGVALPATLTTTSEFDMLGVSSRRMIVEAPLSLRARMFASGVFRPYGDVGMGPMFALGDVEGWLFPQEDDDHPVGWMTRVAAGLEIGQPGGGPTAIVEPLAWSTYHLAGQEAGRFGVMVGAGTRF